MKTKTKLILLEGIPGSGKSSAGARIERFLESAGCSIRFWHEGNFDNPADFEGIACLTRGQYQDLLTHHPELASLFPHYLNVRKEDHLLSYRKLQHEHPQEVPQSLIDELSRLDVYDGISAEEYCRLALDRWRDFQESAQSSDEITMLECCFLQNPLTVLLARHNVDPQVARRQITKIQAVIQGLNPLVIYLAPQDVRAALEHVRAERPKEWADFVTWYLTGQEYGRIHHLQGYEGVIRFYEMRQGLELEILSDLSIRSKVIQHSGGEWERCNDEILGFIRPYL